MHMFLCCVHLYTVHSFYVHSMFCTYTIFVIINERGFIIVCMFYILSHKPKSAQSEKNDDILIKFTASIVVSLDSQNPTCWRVSSLFSFNPSSFPLSSCRLFHPSSSSPSFPFTFPPHFHPHIPPPPLLLLFYLNCKFAAVPTASRAPQCH